ncbi:helix-turn-helix domain-containing protein [Bifidobacterium parmae]|uniref:Integrase n=1 Tax=Bifidobacterium parmae TaxID=361854 RepID=A0A2N5IVQ2_9BIFI|nr:helix-turn-helix domain-containing protein [Bifidobacterium parmae]PLS26018.1 hypothetical protein Uis4E_2193 [Bifidobacterium parmae]
MNRLTVKRILKHHRDGMTPSEIARQLQLPVMQVRDIIRRVTPGPTPSKRPDFQEPPLFD